VTPTRAALVLLVLAATSPSLSLAGDGIRIEDAIRSAWKENPGLAAGAHQVEAAQAEARAARDGHWPTLSVTAKGIGTSEPVGVFGIKLNERRITSEDFDPARLNYPDPTGGFGIGAAVIIPIWMGGRIVAGQNAASAQAGAEASIQTRRREEMALSVVQAYFGVQIGAQGLRYADDVLEHARELERFVGERNAKGLTLDADLARAVAFRAQAEAERAAVQQQLGSARSLLTMLTGIDPERSSLVTPVDPALDAIPALPTLAPAPEGATLQRPDVVAARLRASAAEEGVGMSRASILPAVFATFGVDTLSSSFSQGGAWWSAALVARWEFGASSLGTIQAAEARSAAAASAARWQEVQANREVEDARRAVTTAAARMHAAREAVTASESARSLREARYRQGLLPLSDVLDAEAALAGARALLLRSQFETRIARAQLDLALGLPVEGVQS